MRLGEVRYSTYLVHWPILACLNVLVPAEWSRLVRAEALFVAGAPLTLLSSLLLYRYVECPGIDHGNQGFGSSKDAKERAKLEAERR